MAASRVGVVTAEEKQELLDRYLDIEWLDDTTGSQCVRCGRVPIDHYVSNCQHVYCSNCKIVFSDGRQWKCPQCREYITQLNDQNLHFEYHLYQSRVHCPNKKYGCHYEGQLSTIPGHLRFCEDTRKTTLQTEFNGITLDTKDRSEAHWNDLKERVAGCSDVDRQRKQQADVEQFLKDLKELRDKCEDGWKRVKDNRDELSKDTQELRWDVQEQKEQMARVKPIIKEVKELKEKCEGKWTQTGTIEKRIAGEIGQLRTRVQQQQSKMAQDSNRLTTVNAIMGEMQSALRDLKVTCETQWKEVNKHMDEVKDKDARNALEIQQLKFRLQQQQTQFEEMKKELLSVKKQLKGEEYGRDTRETQPVMNKCEIRLNGMRLVMAKTQMPQDALHSMTLLYQWHIKDIKIDKYGYMEGNRETEVFALTGYDRGATVSLRGGWIHLQLIDYKEAITPIDIKLMPKLTWVIESQSQTIQGKRLNSSQKHSTHAIRTNFILFKESLDDGTDSYGCDISPFVHPPYLMSNGMKVKLYIEPPSMTRSFFSNNGILLWRLDNYRERRQMEVDGLIDRHESPYFYTSPQGYRVLVILQLSEWNMRGRMLFVTGEYDSSLTQQFPHRLTVTLINHTNQSKNVVVSQEGKEADCTYFNFTASASSLASGDHVADDSLLIKAVVEPM